MSHNINLGVKMARGNSGRVIVEIDPEFKQELYVALEKDNLTLKDWFLKNADDYLNDRNGQMNLMLTDNQISQKVKS